MTIHKRNRNEKGLLKQSSGLEATPGFEPGMKVLQTSALPLGYVAPCLLFSHTALLLLTGSTLAYDEYYSLLADSRASHCAKIAAHVYNMLFSLNTRRRDSLQPRNPFGVLARVAGFEPANDGIRIRCLTAWLYPIDVV